MKTISKLYFFIAVLCLLAGCSSEEVDDIGSNPVAVQFSSLVSPLAAQRTVANGTHWQVGDRVGVFMLKENTLLASASIAEGADNKLFLVQNGNDATSGFYPNGTDDIIYYPQNSNVDFVAYYPFTIPLTDYKLPVNVSNQSNLAKIDVLYSNNATGKDKSSGIVDLLFDHALSKLSFTLTSNGGSPNLMGAKIEISNLATKGELNLADGTTSASNSGQTIQASTASDGMSSSAIVIPQTLAGTKLIVTLADNVSSFEWTFTNPQFEQGKNHQYNINVRKTGIDVSVNDIAIWGGAGDDPIPGTHTKIIYKVGDYYPIPDDPKTAIGVVFEVSPPPYNTGKIVSLDETLHVKWGNPTVDEQGAGVAGIRSLNDGQAGTKNLIAKRKDQTDFPTTYGAFNWIYQAKNKGDINGVWYMPANNELTSFWNVFNTDRTGFSAKLKAAGYGGITGDHRFWSLTECNNQYAYYIHLTTGYFPNSVYDKAFSHYAFRVRAIRKF